MLYSLLAFVDIKENCPVCGSPLTEGAESCATCGTAFEEEEIVCPLCQEELEGTEDKCPGCGAELDKLAEAEKSGEPEIISEESADEPEAEPVEEPPSEVAPIESETEEAAHLGAPSDDDDEPPPIAEIDDYVEEGTDDGAEDLPPIESEEEFGELEKKDGLVASELEDLVKLNGIGPLKAQILYDAGYTDLRKLKQATVVELMKVRGIGRKSAGEIKATVRDIDLAEVKQQELKIEQVETEYQCPLCGTVVSAFESSCYECGTTFETDRDEEDEEDSDRLALSYYDSKLLNSPDNAELWYARGSTLVKMEDYDLALKSFDRALEVDPEYQIAWVSKAEVHNRLGDPKKAAECYGHVISRATPAQVDGEKVEGGLDVPDMHVTAQDVQDFEAELEIDEPKPAGKVPEKPAPELEPETVSEEPPTEPESEPEVVEEPEPIEEVAHEPEPEVVEEAKPIEEEPEPEIEETELVAAPEPEPVENEKREIEETELATEPEPAGEPKPEPEEMGPGPPDIQPEEIRTTVVQEPAALEVKMDYTKAPNKEDLEGLSDKELKKLLSTQAAYVKPLLLLSKDMDVDLGPAKRLIAKGVAESKKGDMVAAIKLMGQGVEVIDSRFRAKLTEDLNSLAGLVRELKVSGMDVSKAAELITASKAQVDESQFKEALDTMAKCLELVESVRE